MGPAAVKSLCEAGIHRCKNHLLDIFLKAPP